MRRENTISVSFMMQPISFQLRSDESQAAANIETPRSAMNKTHLLNTLEQRRVAKQNFLKERFRDIN